LIAHDPDGLAALVLEALAEDFYRRALYEYYLRGAGETPDEAEWRTEIGWPIFRADASRAYG
jgi:hypothetical protein